MADDKTVEYGVGEAPHADADERGEHVVVTPAEGKSTETAQALLDAAEKLGLPASAVGSTDSSFTASQEVVDAANLPEGDAETVVGDDSGRPAAKADTPPKKAAARPARAKAAKSTPAKSTAAKPTR